MGYLYTFLLEIYSMDYVIRKCSIFEAPANDTKKLFCKVENLILVLKSFINDEKAQIVHNIFYCTLKSTYNGSICDTNYTFAHIDNRKSS